MFGINFQEQNFVFGCRWWSFVFCFFSMVFCLGFCFIFFVSRSRKCTKILLHDVRSSLLGSFSLSLSLSFRFCSDVALYIVSQVVTGRTPHAFFWSVSFSLFCPRRACLSPFLAVRPSFLAFCRGAFLDPVCFGFFVGFSRYFGALRLLAPSEALFWTRGGKGVLVDSFCCFCFPPSVVFAAFSRQREGADPSSHEAYPGSSNSACARVRARGAPSCAPIWTRAFCQNS